MPVQCAFSKFSASIYRFACQLCRHMKGCGAAGQCHGIFTSQLVTGYALDFIYILTYRAHPVGLVGFRDIREFLSVHERSRKPHLFLKCFQRCVLLSKRHLFTKPSYYSITIHFFKEICRFLGISMDSTAHEQALLCFMP